jgi:hypothetical protein
VVPVVRPVRETLTGWLVVPEPTAWGDVLEAPERPESVPHSNHAVVTKPLGVTFPFNVAPVAPTEVANKVATVGGLPGEEVEKLTISPLEGPLLFSAQNRK